MIHLSFKDVGDNDMGENVQYVFLMGNVILSGTEKLSVEIMGVAE